MRRLLLLGFFIAIIGGGGWYIGSQSSQFGIGGDSSQTTATYAFEDWMVVCVSREQGLPCEMSQQLVNGQTGSVVAKFSIAYSPTEEKHALQIAMPLGVWLEPGIALNVGDMSVTDIKFSRCMPQGCMIEAVLEDPMLAEMKKGGDGQVVLFDRNKQKIGLPFSLKGFADADAKLRTQTRIMTEGNAIVAWTIDRVEAWFGDLGEEQTDVVGPIEVEGGVDQ